MSELKALKAARGAANKSRYELATKCQISVTTYQRYEAGQANVPEHHRRIIAHELKLPKNNVAAYFDPASKPVVTARIVAAKKPNTVRAKTTKAERIAVILASDIPESSKRPYRPNVVVQSRTKHSFIVPTQTTK